MPPKLDTLSGSVRVNLVTSESWVERVDEWRRQQKSIPSRAEAIRALVDMGLEAAAAGHRPGDEDRD